MDRESIDVSVCVSGDGRPELAIDLADAAASMTERLRDPEGGQLSPGDVDVTYRETDAERPGVLALANRLTGEFVLEAPLDRERLAALVEAVLDADAVLEGDDEDRGEYELRLTGEDESVTFEKETLLVYDDDGNLARSRSLIPGGVEL